MQMAAEPDAPRPVAPVELGFERIVYTKQPPRATIRLNRPEVLNAFDFRMLREIARACEDASWDDEIRVVVVTGTGRAFCVGADLKERQQMTEKDVLSRLQFVRALYLRLERLPFPVSLNELLRSVGGLVEGDVDDMERR